ncbi:hypothetical protein KKC94_00845 [Patescibacteria group bacterium]|nr:hypothetical protein [Patescibacteria group bacterium]
MLKQLFTSNARVKLMTLFLINPEKEYFVRELTRMLDEQINSVRRELDNLKNIGLLKTHTKNRKKFYTVNKNFTFYSELRSIIVKSNNSSESLIKNIAKMGSLDFLLISGVFMNKDSQVDLLAVGEVDKEKLKKYLDTLETHRSIRFSTLSTEDFIYRLKCRDKFTLDLIQDPDNLIGVNKLEKHLK